MKPRTFGSVRLGEAMALACLLALSSSNPRAVHAADKPRLSLRAAPLVGTPSTVFVFQAILQGGADTEDLYCLTTEWTWEEQADSSLNETECPPFKPGETKIERSFNEEQTFRSVGSHLVRVALRKGDREIASAATSVKVRPEP